MCHFAIQVIRHHSPLPHFHKWYKSFRSGQKKAGIKKSDYTDFLEGIRGQLMNDSLIWRNMTGSLGV